MTKNWKSQEESKLSRYREHAIYIGNYRIPEGVMLTHYNIANNGFLTGEHMKFTADDKLCVCVPFFHCFVVLATMNCLTHGCTEVMVERFNPLVVLASIHKERCTALYGVPTMFIAELQPSHVRHVRPLQPPYGYHGRFPLPGRADEAGGRERCL